MQPPSPLTAVHLALTFLLTYQATQTQVQAHTFESTDQKPLSSSPQHDTSDAPSCPPHHYTTTLISHSPLAIYIPGFLTASELTHLQSTPSTEFTRSSISDASGEQHNNARTRTSRSASLSAASDPVVWCIAERARKFQSLSLPRENIEPLQLVKYGAPGDEYHEHTDWFTSASQTTAEMGGNRQSSFFVYVHVSDDIVGGGTRFPFLDAPGVPKTEALGTGFLSRAGAGAGAGIENVKGDTMGKDGEEEWCKWIDCGEPWENGVTFRPVQGSAVFWVNLLKGGKGDDRTVHAGLPVLRGRKMGMNIWTRERKMHARFRGEE